MLKYNILFFLPPPNIHTYGDNFTFSMLHIVMGDTFFFFFRIKLFFLSVFLAKFNVK